ncbi:MAG: peptidase M28, partial [Blastocatellia bacterium]|nr:peptidase M28 [Blastocatellia bacterium]
MVSKRLKVFVSILLLLSNGLGITAQTNAVPAIPKALASSIVQMKGERILKNTKTLASDEYEGRAPGTRGEQLTTQYLAKQFREAGLRPGNPDGSFFQAVPLVGYKTVPQIALAINGKSVPLKFLEDFVHVLPRLKKIVKVEISDVVFAGYGIVAPQYGWDDYKDADVRNKLVLVLSGEPSRRDATDAKKSDATFFRGETRTYYSARESKWVQAAKRGAAGILVTS